MAEGRTRQSNIELLRIISMMMVVVVHLDGAALGLPSAPGVGVLADSRAVWKLAVESFTIIGVNCFTLISGYFGIRLRLRSAVTFLLMCLFYSLIVYAFGIATGYASFSFDSLCASVQVLSRTDLWYVPAYFCLMLLSPFLNTAADTQGQRKFGIILAVFVIFNLWCGWGFGCSFNPTGYTVIQLVMVYLTGRYINMHRATATRMPAYVSVSAYLLLTALIFMSSLWLDSRTAFAYNSPAVFGASVAFFLIFLRMRFTSRIINGMAAGAFAVYLIHKNPIIWGNILSPEASEIWHSTGLTAYTVWCVAVCGGLFAVAMFAERVRRILFNACEAVCRRKAC